MRRVSQGRSPAQVLRRWWDLIDRQDWERMAALLDPGVRARWVHTGECFDAAGLVPVNREYPGRWRAEVEECLADGSRAATRTKVSDGSEVYYAASFATVSDGRISDLVELWADAHGRPPAGRRSL